MPTESWPPGQHASVGPSVPARWSEVGQLIPPASKSWLAPATECWSHEVASGPALAAPSRSQFARWPRGAHLRSRMRGAAVVVPGSTTTTLGGPRWARPPATRWPLGPRSAARGPARPAPRSEDGWGHSSSSPDGTDPRSLGSSHPQSIRGSDGSRAGPRTGHQRSRGFHSLQGSDHLAGQDSWR